MKAKRIYEYDLVRMIATYSVVLVHISAIALMGYQQGSALSMGMILINRMLKFTTPVFIFLAGSLIHAKYDKEKFEYRQFIIGRIKRIVIPYFFVSGIYYLLLVYLGHGTISAADFMKQFLAGSAQYHLYFIPIIMQLYFMTPLFIHLKEKINLKLLLMMFIVISYISVLYMKFQFSDRIFIKFIVPYVIGLYFGNHIVSFIKSLGNRIYIYLGVSLIVGLLYSYEFGMYFYGMESSEITRDSLWFVYCILSCVTLTWIASVFIKNETVKKVSKKISSVSYYIYLLHPLFIAASEKVLNRLGVNSVSIRFLFNVVFVISVSTIAALTVTWILKLKLYSRYKRMHRLKKAVVAMVLLVAVGMPAAFVYGQLVDRGYVISYKSKAEVKKVEKLREEFQEESKEYINSRYGFKFYYDDLDKDVGNERVKTTFGNENTVVDIYYENLEGTVHTSQTFTHYGNRSIVDGSYITVDQDEFVDDNGLSVHVLKWSRPALRKIENDLNHYASLDVIIGPYEVYNIAIRSNEEIDPFHYLSRFEVVDKVLDAPLHALELNRVENAGWDKKTSGFYEEKFVRNEVMDWGLFEPTTIKGLEPLKEIEEKLGYDFKYLLQYYNLNSYINDENIKEIYESGKILEFTLQTSVYGEYDPDVTLKILDGAYEEEIDAIVEKIIKIDNPVLFRLNNEMNGDWCTYNAFFYQKDTSIYNELWKYIYKKFEEKGADNVIWVWNPNELGFPNFKWNHYTNYFPGEEYVDIIGVTGYNTGDFYVGETWRSFEDIYDEFMPEYAEMFKGYPFMITEFGSSTFGGDKAEWIKSMLDVVEKYDFKAAIYWNSIDYTPEREKARVYKFDDDSGVMNIFKNHFAK